MRPKRLEIEGLQSFKEAQIVDFTYLGETGLFGIFGPTGSGKSTILDAITFALYGKVKRADRGTQGIINMERNIARVSFTFNLLKDGKRKTYRVERAYQRKKNAANLGSCEPKVVRLLEVTPLGDLPLCDKATDVSNQVEALLGLNHEDFTRAVVLPQNSFQEFLLLDNSKKRAMLERVFYLEEYGRGLLDKITRRMSQLKSEKDQLSGQMAAYEDATKEAVVAARKELDQANSERSQWIKQLSKVEEEHKAAANKWQLTQALMAIETQEAKLLSKKPVMEEARQQLECAQRAEGLKAQIEQTTWYREQLIEAQNNEKNTQEKLSIALEKLNQVKNNLLKLREESALQQPVLVERKTRLNEGLAYVRDISQLEQELLKIRADWKGKNEESKALKKKMEANEKALVQVTEELAKVEQSLQTIRVKPADRKLLQQGMQLEEQWQALKTQLKEESKASEQLASKLLTLEKAKKQAEQALAEAGKAQEHWQKVLTQQEADQKADASYHLALALEDNQPCPVCGSMDHPAPANANIISKDAVSADAISEDAILATKQKLEEATVLLNTKEREHIQLQTEWLFITEQKKEQIAKLAILEEAVTKAETEVQDFVKIQPLPRESGESLKSAWEALAQKDEAAWQLEAKQNQLQKQLEVLRQENQGCQATLQPLEQAITVINTQGSSLAKQKTDLTEKLHLLTGGLDIKSEITKIEAQLSQYIQLDQTYQVQQTTLQTEYDELQAKHRSYQNRITFYQEGWQKEQGRLLEALMEHGFASVVVVEKAFLSQEEQAKLREELKDYDQTLNKLSIEKNLNIEKLAGQRISQEQWLQMEVAYEEALTKRDASVARSETAKSQLALLEERHEQWRKVQASYIEVAKVYEYHEQILKLLKGDRSKDNSFIDYIAEERLRYVALKASEILGDMTQYKYGLELDTQLGFMIRDHGNGGILRMVSTLSGGEVFLTSLALALALSEQIQLKGQSPLEFFFLDEGFGTLDGDLLDTVIDALEGLSSNNRMIGLISHVPELRSRMGRRLIVEPPNMQGAGSCIHLEKA